jgi:hypothetical protein
MATVVVFNVVKSTMSNGSTALNRARSPRGLSLHPFRRCHRRTCSKVLAHLHTSYCGRSCLPKSIRSRPLCISQRLTPLLFVGRHHCVSAIALETPISSGPSHHDRILEANEDCYCPGSGSEGKCAEPSACRSNTKNADQRVANSVSTAQDLTRCSEVISMPNRIQCDDVLVDLVPRSIDRYIRSARVKSSQSAGNTDPCCILSKLSARWPREKATGSSSSHSTPLENFYATGSSKEDVHRH